MTKRMASIPNWLPNPMGLPAQPPQNPSSQLFGDAASRTKYWLPDPPGANYPGLQGFWDRLSADITEYRTAQLHQDPPGRPLAVRIRPEELVRSNAVSRQSNSPNWSGAAVQAVDGGTFTHVVGCWQEPEITTAGTFNNSQEFRSSVWIGLNGHAAYDDAALPQIGTMQQMVYKGTARLTKHFVWFEWWAYTKGRDIDPNLLPVYLKLDVEPGDIVLASVELIPSDLADIPLVARMCVCVEHTDKTTSAVTKVLIMPFIVYPPEVAGRRVQPAGSTANWIAELPTNVDRKNPFLMPRFGTGLAPSNSVTFENCAAALAAEPTEPIYAERTLDVSSRFNMFGRRNEGTGPVGKIATTLMPRHGDTSFSIQVDGNLP